MYCLECALVLCLGTLGTCGGPAGYPPCDLEPSDCTRFVSPGSFEGVMRKAFQWLPWALWEMSTGVGRDPRLALEYK